MEESQRKIHLLVTQAYVFILQGLEKSSIQIAKFCKEDALRMWNWISESVESEHSTPLKQIQ